MPTRLATFAGPDARRLVLVRHGRTAWNRTRRAQGHTDIPLDDVGRAQAAALAGSIAALRPVRLWSSDLARASETADYLGRACGLSVQLDARLREYSVGDRSGLTREEFQERFPREYAAWQAGDESLLVAGAESTADVVSRMVPALREHLSELDRGQTGVVVTHGACLRAAMLVLLELPEEADGAFATMGNCTWTTLQENGFGGRLRLAGYNAAVPDDVAVATGMTDFASGALLA